MQFIRTRMKASDFKEVGRKGGLVIVRWDATPETITIPARKKGGEDITKESGYVICSEFVSKGEISDDAIRAIIAKDLSVRYPDGDAPEIAVPKLDEFNLSQSEGE